MHASDEPPKDVFHDAVLVQVAQQIMHMAFVEVERLVCGARQRLEQPAALWTGRAVAGAMKHQQRQADQWKCVP